MSSTIELSNTIIMPLKNVDNNAVAGAVTVNEIVLKSLTKKR